MATLKEIARKKLGIQPANRIILSIDGGGIRGIYTLQLLKRLEELAGSLCYQLVDMVSGTSTGAIFSGLILNKNDTLKIEEHHVQLVSRVFTKWIFLANQYYNPTAPDNLKLLRIVTLKP